MKTLIKICGVKNPVIAVAAAKAGADFIGLIHYAPSSRHVSIETMQAITQALKNTSALPVLVVVDKKADEIQAICEETDIYTVQLHGDAPRRTHAQLPLYYQRIYLCELDSEYRLLPDKSDGLAQLNAARDFLLIDPSHGSGRVFDWEKFTYQEKFRWFLAGGLTPSNVEKAISLLHPSGVDVSTGVENVEKEKDFELIKQFIRSAYHA